MSFTLIIEPGQNMENNTSRLLVISKYKMHMVAKSEFIRFFTSYKGKKMGKTLCMSTERRKSEEDLIFGSSVLLWPRGGETVVFWH